MRKLLFLLMAFAPWLLASADYLELKMGSTQEEFNQNWTILSGVNNWTYDRYTENNVSYVETACWTSVDPIPEAGAILAYKTGIGIQAGSYSFYAQVSSADNTAQCLEVVASTDADFSNPANIISVKGTDNNSRYGNVPTGNNAPKLEVPTDGIYYLGIRVINQYNGVTTAPGRLRVWWLAMTYNPYTPPTEPDVKPIDLPYENGLNYTGCLDGFTLNPETGGWQYTVNNTVVINGPGAGYTQATLITPAFAVEDGKQYIVSFEVSGNPNSGFTVKRGSSIDALEYVESIDLDNTAETYSVTVDGNDTGVMYIAFDGNCFARSSIQLSKLKIEEYVKPVAPIELPYENGLNYTGCLDGFTLNPETGGWQYTVNNTVVINGPGTGYTQATLITPAFAVEDGKQYIVSFDASGNPNSTITVKSGSSIDSLEGDEEQNLSNSTASYSAIVTGNATGVMYIAFDGNCFARSSIQLSNLKIEEYVEPVAPIELPYENALNYAGCLDGFTLNPETGGWQFTVNNTVVINGPGSGYTQATLITPAFAVEDGKQYIVSFEASGNQNSTLKVMSGASIDTLEKDDDGPSLTNSLAPYSAIVTGNATGVMYIAFDGNCFARSSLQIKNLSIKEYIPLLEIPYENALNYEGCLDGFTLNPETGGWQYTVNNTVVINGPGAGYTQATLITPPFAVEDGKQYKVTFDASGNPNSTITVKSGASIDSLEGGEGQNLTNSAASYSAIVSGDATGVMYIAFDGNCFARSSIQLSNLSVVEFVPTIDDYSGTLTPGENEDENIIEYVEGAEGEGEFTLPIILDVTVGPMEYQGFQFDIVVPDFLSLPAVDEENEGAVVLPFDGSVRYSQIGETEDNLTTYRVVAYLDEGYTTTGEIATLNLVYDKANLPKPTTKNGTEEYTVTISAVDFSTTNGQDIPGITGETGTVYVKDVTNYTASVDIENVEIAEPSYSSTKFEEDPNITVGESLDFDIVITGENENEPSDEGAEITVTINGSEIPADKLEDYITYDPETGEATFDSSNVTVPEGEESVTVVITVKSGDAEATLTFTVSGLLLGDSNDNGIVTVSDVVTTANYIVELPVDRFDYPNANVILNDGEMETGNRNGITVQDVVATVDIVLEDFDGNRNPQATPVRRRANVMTSTDALVASNFKGGNNTISVDLVNNMAYTAIQAIVIIPEGMTVKNVSLGERANGHHLVYNMVDNQLRVVIFSYTNENFSNAAGALFNIDVEASEDCGGIRIDGIRAADVRSNGYTLSFDGGQNETGTTGIDGIDTDDSNARYFTVDGIEVFNPEKGQILIRVKDGEATKVVK